MSKYEKALLARIFRGPLPMTLIDEMDIDAVRILHGCGYVEVAFERVLKSKADHEFIISAVVKKILVPFA